VIPEVVVNRVIACLLLLLAASGCSSTAPVPEDRFYRLEPVGPLQSLERPLLTGGLAVGDVLADPMRSGRAILYGERDRPLQLKRYHYEFWVDQPPRMVHQVLLSWLRASGVADSVADGDDVSAAWRLSGQLLKFEEIRDDSGAAHVEVAMQFSLSSASSNRPLWTRDYTRRQPVGGEPMYATAQAMQSALTGLFSELQADLAAPAL
jgi:ABC-type uncharacterized transport system auxiliary subunit